jgi:hypothetical protein
MELAFQALIAWNTWKDSARRRLGSESGEGVISTAIAVLIMALLGLAMWQLFDRVFTNAGQHIETNVNNIG